MEARPELVLLLQHRRLPIWTPTLHIGIRGFIQFKTEDGSADVVGQGCLRLRC